MSVIPALSAISIRDAASLVLLTETLGLGHTYIPILERLWGEKGKHKGKKNRDKREKIEEKNHFQA